MTLLLWARYLLLALYAAVVASIGWMHWTDERHS